MRQSEGGYYGEMRAVATSAKVTPESRRAPSPLVGAPSPRVGGRRKQLIECSQPMTFLVVYELPRMSRESGESVRRKRGNLWHEMNEAPNCSIDQSVK